MAFDNKIQDLDSAHSATTILGERITKIENTNEIIETFAVVSAASGTITAPEGATILLGRYGGAGDALCFKLGANGYPDEEVAKTNRKTFVKVKSFDVDGNYQLNAEPSDYPISVIYQISISTKDVAAMDINTILDRTTEAGLDEIISPFTPIVTSSATPLTGYNWSDLVNYPVVYSSDQGQSCIATGTSGRIVFTFSEQKDIKQMFVSNYINNNTDSEFGAQAVKVYYSETDVPSTTFEDTTGLIVIPSIASFARSNNMRSRTPYNINVKARAIVIDVETNYSGVNWGFHSIRFTPQQSVSSDILESFADKGGNSMQDFTADNLHVDDNLNVSDDFHIKDTSSSTRFHANSSYTSLYAAKPSLGGVNLAQLVLSTPDSGKLMFYYHDGARYRLECGDTKTELTNSEGTNKITLASDEALLNDSPLLNEEIGDERYIVANNVPSTILFIGGSSTAANITVNNTRVILNEALTGSAFTLTANSNITSFTVSDPNNLLDTSPKIKVGVHGDGWMQWWMGTTGDELTFTKSGNTWTWSRLSTGQKESRSTNSNGTIPEPPPSLGVQHLTSQGGTITINGTHAMVNAEISGAWQLLTIADNVTKFRISDPKGLLSDDHKVRIKLLATGTAYWYIRDAGDDVTFTKTGAGTWTWVRESTGQAESKTSFNGYITAPTTAHEHKLKVQSLEVADGIVTPFSEMGKGENDLQYIISNNQTISNDNSTVFFNVSQGLASYTYVAETVKTFKVIDPHGLVSPTNKPRLYFRNGGSWKHLVYMPFPNDEVIFTKGDDELWSWYRPKTEQKGTFGSSFNGQITTPTSIGFEGKKIKDLVTANHTHPASGGANDVNFVCKNFTPYGRIISQHNVLDYISFFNSNDHPIAMCVSNSFKQVWDSNGSKITGDLEVTGDITGNLPSTIQYVGGSATTATITVNNTRVIIDEAITGTSFTLTADPKITSFTVSDPKRLLDTTPRIKVRMTGNTILQWWMGTTGDEITFTKSGETWTWARLNTGQKESRSTNGNGVIPEPTAELGGHTHDAVSNNVLTVSTPLDARYKATGGTGALGVRLPSGAYGMLSFDINVYSHANDDSFVVRVSGYAYSTSWSSTTATIISSTEANNFIVRFCKDDSYHYVMVGESNASWGHCHFVVTNFRTHYGNLDPDVWGKNWNIALYRTFPTLKAIKSNNFAYADFNRMVNKPDAIEHPKSGSFVYTSYGTVVLWSDSASVAFVWDHAKQAVKVKSNGPTLSVGFSAKSELIAASSITTTSAGNNNTSLTSVYKFFRNNALSSSPIGLHVLETSRKYELYFWIHTPQIQFRLNLHKDGWNRVYWRIEKIGG